MDPLEFVGETHGDMTWGGFSKVIDLITGVKHGRVEVSTTANISTIIGSNATGIATSMIKNSNFTSGQPEFLLSKLGRAILQTFLDHVSDVNWFERHLFTTVNYLASKFAVLCMGMAIVLNRTVVFATTRRPMPLDWPSRAFLRGLALTALIYNSLPLLTALHCLVPSLRYFIPFAVSEPGAQCPGPEVLWSLYQAISLSNLIETFSSVVQGRVPYSETGMTLFEYSAAFQEVELSRTLSTQILVISLISVCSQIALHIQGLFNTSKYRLLISTFFGGSLLVYFGFSVFTGKLFYFPSICVIGYLPQLAIALMVILCFSILSLTALFGGGRSNLPTGFHLLLDENDDFYSYLMEVGIIALASASKATYFFESSSLTAPTNTWIEQQHIQTKSYDNELLLPPSMYQREWNHLRSGPTGVTTINRVLHSLELGRSFAAILLRSIWKNAFKSSTNQSNDVDNNENQPRLVQFNDAVFDDESDDDYVIEDEDIPEDEDEDEDMESTNRDDSMPDYYSLADSFLEDELVDLFKDGDMAADLLQNVIIPANHPLRQASLTRRRSSRSKGLGERDYTEMMDMASLIWHRRREAMAAVEMRRKNGETITFNDADRYLCVVCKVQPREVVLWPCRCFAICEDCRLALAFKNFKGCVCCRRDVNAFSRVYLP